MRRLPLLLTAALFALLSSQLPAKTIYQCVDHAGNTVMSDGGGCRQAKQKVPSRASQSSASASTSSTVKPAGSSAKIKQCDSTGCWDEKRVRYTKSGNIYLSSDGRTCKRQGLTLYCN